MSSFDKNKPGTWACSEIYSPPASFDMAGYQSKIDAILGKSDTNHSVVRLVWAGDRKLAYSPFYVTWKPSGFGLSSELRAKYKYASLQVPGTSDIIDVPPPRWIFEEFNHPGQYMAAWEATRWQEIDGHRREVRPAPPPNGYYSHLLTIADHGNHQCCEQAKKDYVVCWGNYREPDETDLNILRRAKMEREKDRFIDTTKPLDAETLNILGKETEDRVKEQRRLIDKKVEEYIDENFLELCEAVGLPVTGKARAAYSIPKQKTENGIIIP
jgi:hypothetical protein